MAIQAKKKPTIKKGNGYVYNPDTFFKDFHKENNVEVHTAQEILDNIKPLEFMDRKFIFFDTETHPYYKSSHDVPKGVVRRWVGTGKKAVPQDYPFSFQVSDGTTNFCLYSSIEEGFKELKKLQPLFEDGSIDKVAHNTKYDMHMLANVGMKLVGRLHDTVVVCKLTNENRPSFELKVLCTETAKGIDAFEHLVDSYKQLNKVTDYRQIPKELLTEYGCTDVWNCCQVFIENYPKIFAEGIDGVYKTEMEAMVALYEMERLGMLTDAEYENPLKSSLQETVSSAEQAVYDMAGKVFNMNSNKQVYDVMLSLGVDASVLHFTEKGNVKLDKDEMARLDEVYHIPIISKIQEYKKAEKLLNTYAIGIYDQADSEGRVHGSINQTEALTGRMSITKPALQTLPKKDKRIRKIFIPGQDNEMWFFDLDQVEYRLYAHYAKAKKLIEQINNGYDVHTATAALLFHKDLEQFTKDIDAEIAEATSLRANGKTINFALVYGVGIDHLAELLHCSTSEASDTKYRYFAQFPEARIFINTVYEVVKQRGFVKNFYGRRRRLKVDECYKAPNSLIQGCAADYIKNKLVLMYKYIKYNHLDTTMNNIVHDELILTVPEYEKQHAPVLRYLMSDFDNFRCNITAGAEFSAESWGQKSTAHIDFAKPEDMSFVDYDVFNGDVFDIGKDIA